MNKGCGGRFVETDYNYYCGQKIKSGILLCEECQKKNNSQQTKPKGNDTKTKLNSFDNQVPKDKTADTSKIKEEIIEKELERLAFDYFAQWQEDKDAHIEDYFKTLFLIGYNEALKKQSDEIEMWRNKYYTAQKTFSEHNDRIKEKTK